MTTDPAKAVASVVFDAEGNPSPVWHMGKGKPGTTVFLTEMPQVSENTARLIGLLQHRDAVGREKYGVTLDRDDLSLSVWLQHMTEELLDGAGYAQAALRLVTNMATLAKRLDKVLGRHADSMPKEAYIEVDAVMRALAAAKQPEAQAGEDDEQRARDLLAAEWRASGHDDMAMRIAQPRLLTTDNPAIRAIMKALAMPKPVDDGAVVAYRLVRQSHIDGSWKTYSAQWIDGKPEPDLLADIANDPRWRIEYAYAAPAGSGYAASNLSVGKYGEWGAGGRLHGDAAPGYPVLRGKRAIAWFIQKSDAVSWVASHLTAGSGEAVATVLKDSLEWTRGPIAFYRDHPPGTKLYAGAPPASGQGEALASLIVRDVAELPDRNSPEDWPEAMIVTGEELRSIVVDRLTRGGEA